MAPPPEGYLGLLVMQSVADDYEDFTMIFETVKQRSRSSSEGAIKRVLSNLIERGYISTYLLSPQPPHCTLVEFRPEELQAVWFYLTASGLALLEKIEAEGEMRSE